jgi:transposase
VDVGYACGSERTVAQRHRRKEPVVGKTIRYVGLDQHAGTIAVAVAEGGRDGEVRSLGTIANRPEAIRKLVAKLGAPEGLRFCYEAGPCGYGLYWQLVQLGAQCEVIAPTLIPTKPGERVKTDRLDAEKLARCHRSGDLTAVWVPSAEQEALRDLVRAREAAKEDQLRARNRLGKFLLRQGRHRPEESMAWGSKHLAWLKTLKFEQRAQEMTFADYLREVEHAKERVGRLESSIREAIAEAPASLRAVITGLEALRGVKTLTAVTVVTEIGQFSRFAAAPQLMSFSGLVPSEHSTGGPGKARRGAITKTGNAHVRRVLVEAAWAYRHRPSVAGDLARRNKLASEEAKTIAWKAQHRLHARFWRLSASGKPKPKVTTAIARELLGFMWAIGAEAERAHQPLGKQRKAAV